MASNNKTTRMVKILQVLQKRKSNTMLGNFSTRYGPFQILIGTILSARSRDEVTAVICKDLFKKYPTAKKLASASKKDVIFIIRKIGFFNNKSRMIMETSRIIHEKYNDNVPSTMEGLLGLPGVGRKVAGCVLVYAFGKDAIPVDTHVHRISNRLGIVKTKQPEQTEQALMKLVPRKYWQMVNDTLVSYGKEVCKPITPYCSSCVIKKYCKQVNVKKWK